jgi:hypothetical protein
MHLKPDHLNKKPELGAALVHFDILMSGRLQFYMKILVPRLYYKIPIEEEYL